MALQIAFDDGYILNSTQLNNSGDEIEKTAGHFSRRMSPNKRLDNVVSLISEMTIKNHFKSVGGNSAINIRPVDVYFKSIIKSVPWLPEFLEESSEIDNPKLALPYYRKFNNLLLNNDFEKCDKILKVTNTDDLSMLLLVGMPRLFFQWREKLSSWELFLKGAEESIKEKGFDPKVLLKGIVQG
jgi:hypothetical protein